MNPTSIPNFPQSFWQWAMQLAVVLSVFAMLGLNRALWKGAQPTKWVLLLTFSAIPFLATFVFLPEWTAQALNNATWQILFQLLFLASAGFEFWAVLRFKPNLHPLVYRLFVWAIGLGATTTVTSILLWLRQMFLGADKVYGHVILAFLARVGILLHVANISLSLMLLHWFALGPRRLLFQAATPPAASTGGPENV